MEKQNQEESLKRIREAAADTAFHRSQLEQLHVTPAQALSHSSKCCISATSHPAINPRTIKRLCNVDRAANAASQQVHKKRAEQIQAQAIRDEAINFVDDRIDVHHCGALNVICQFCHSKIFIGERSSGGKFTTKFLGSH